MPLEIRIDRGECIGSENCCVAAPGVFALDTAGVAEVVDPAAESEESILIAARDCPTKAISILRGGKRIV
jgi:ferredoxin